MPAARVVRLNHRRRPWLPSGFDSWLHRMVGRYVLVPPGHGDWLAAHVPGCSVKVDDAGHLGRDRVEEIAEDVRWLRDGTPPA